MYLIERLRNSFVSSASCLHLPVIYSCLMFGVGRIVLSAAKLDKARAVNDLQAGAQA